MGALHALSWFIDSSCNAVCCNVSPLLFVQGVSIYAAFSRYFLDEFVSSISVITFLYLCVNIIILSPSLSKGQSIEYSRPVTCYWLRLYMRELYW